MVLSSTKGRKKLVSRTEVWESCREEETEQERGHVMREVDGVATLTAGIIYQYLVFDVDVGVIVIDIDFFCWRSFYVLVLVPVPAHMLGMPKGSQTFRFSVRRESLCRLRCLKPCLLGLPPKAISRPIVPPKPLGSSEAIHP